MDHIREGSDVTVESVLAERCDGNRNVLHACVSTCFPTTSREIETDHISAFLDAPPKPNDHFLGSFSWPSSAGSIGDGSDDLLGLGSSSKSGGNSLAPSMPSLSIFPPEERKHASLTILKMICECPKFSAQHMRTLLSAKDSNGQTPFMSAVAGRAYKAALILFDIIQKVAKIEAMDVEGVRRAVNSMIFPIGSNPDDSPLHVLCYNDTCSFTWTGALHINQDIFECRTCGLTGSLCCCTECARVCHKGHDCKLKQTSPTAYCDCWEKCKCKAVKAGHQGARFELLTRLLSETDLVNYANGRGENLMLFLLQTVRRQVTEQRQWKDSSSQASLSSSRKSSMKEEATLGLGHGGSDVPDHDLEPPKFARKALDFLLDDWRAVRAMIMTGFMEGTNDAMKDLDDHNLEGRRYMRHQGHTAHLDKFTYCLLVKLDESIKQSNKHKNSSNPSDEEFRRQVSDTLLTMLLSTLVKEMKNTSIEGRKEEALKVAKRFMASVVRIFVVLAVESAPQNNNSNNSNSSSKKKLPAGHPLSKCNKVFSALLPLAVWELVSAADALMLPVRLNCVKPTIPFNLTAHHLEAWHGCEEMFQVKLDYPNLHILCVHYY